jgi:hypothetical protein
MTVTYPGHWLRTPQQGIWLCVVQLVVLLPLVALRIRTQPIGAGMALAMLTLAPFVIAYQSSRFLERQERLHAEPTPEMIFVFRFVVNTPLTFGAFLFVVLTSLR